MISARRALTTILFFTFCGAAGAQQSDWTQVTLKLLETTLAPAHLQESQRRNIEQQVTSVAKQDSWECSDKDDLAQLLAGLRYEQIPVKDSAKNVIVTSGVGCARGGQGANGAMWLFNVSGNRPKYLGELSGWGPGVIPTGHSGYRDLVTGWHVSAYETALTYYRFDGKRYRPTDHAKATADQNENWAITPAKSAITKH